MDVKYSVPIIFSKSFFSLLNNGEVNIDYIDNIYGSSRSFFLGQAKYCETIPEVSSAELRYYIQIIHELGIKFHYTMNAPWCNGIERNQTGRDKIIRTIEYLANLNVDAFIIANPYLIDLCNREFPEIPIIGSINMKTTTMYKLEMLFELGCSKVVIDKTLNRNIKFLESLGPLKKKVILLVNSTCLFDCPLEQYHVSENSHLSSGSNNITNDVNFCIDYCIKQYVKNPENLLKTSWIRPEDIDKYQNIGIEYFKIQGRTLTENEVFTLIRSYIAGSSPKNDLISIFPGFAEKLLLKSKELNMSIPMIKNSFLEENNFIDSFFNKKVQCQGACKICRHCLKMYELITERLV